MRILRFLGQLTSRSLPLALAFGCRAGNESNRPTSLPGTEAILPVVRSEGTVTVYEHAADALDRAPRLALDPVPVMTVGGAEGDPQFDLTWVSSVVLLSDGRLMTFAYIGNKVLLFDQNGRGVRAFGRTGKGPGDWMRLGEPQQLAADTLLVVDFGNQRVNWLTPESGVVRTEPITVTGTLLFMSRVAGLLPDGQVVLHRGGTWGNTQRDSLNRTLDPIVRFDLASSTSRTITQIVDLDGADVETRFRGRHATEWMPYRLGGWALVAVWDSVIATATTASPAMDLLRSDGTIQARIAMTRPSRPVTQAMRDAQIATELARLDGARAERAVDPDESRRIARVWPFADSLPRYSNLFATDEGILWAVDGSAPSDSTWSATALRHDGAIVGRLEVAGAATPMAFRGDRVVVRTKDADDVVALQVFRIVPAHR